MQIWEEYRENYDESFENAISRLSYKIAKLRVVFATK